MTSLGPTVRLLAPDDPAWQETVDSYPHDFYHLPAYVQVDARHQDGTPRAVLVEDKGKRLLLPLVLRPIATRQDATSPYGYPGPIGDLEDGSFVREAFASAIDLLASEGVVSLFVRLHPLIQTGVTALPGHLADHGDVVSIDLGRGLERIWAETRLNHRRQIRRAQDLGFVAEPHADDAAVVAFERLYLMTMRRLGASSNYLFESEYFARLREALGARLSIFLVRLEATVVAGAMIIEEDGIVQYHLAGSDTDYLHVQPTKLLIHAATAWASERGNRWLVLGGGVGAAQDSLMHFKAGFSPVQHRFRTLRIVVDEAAYEDLVRDGHPDADTDPRTGYFPAYRSPD